MDPGEQVFLPNHVYSGKSEKVGRTEPCPSPLLVCRRSLARHFRRISLSCEVWRLLGINLGAETLNVELASLKFGMYTQLPSQLLSLYYDTSKRADTSKQVRPVSI